ncbi:SDR family oxidoreductase [Microbacterium sp. EST19A]|uniref:SDR family oxidoreductase n=1 Tax=Microbacterium sp. EST19A TaxID=2862681 RepID=UPI001CC001CD|nr:NAD(P)H-binding protein [Microbacterium sp. EST19A]
MSTPILVTGGTGNIGRHTVPLLRAADREVRILSRHADAAAPGIRSFEGDTVKGTGLAEALDGVETVLHLAGGAKGDDVAARNLVAAARRTGVRHLILISVVGADRMPIGYFRMKAAAEREFAESGIPWTVVRVAQLHDFALPIVKALSRMRIAPRGLRFETVRVDAVAARLAELTLSEPAGRVADLAGPEVQEVADLVRTFDAARGRTHRLLPLRIPGGVGRAYRAGDNLADETAVRAGSTWAEYLGERTSVAA